MILRAGYDLMTPPDLKTLASLRTIFGCSLGGNSIRSGYLLSVSPKHEAGFQGALWLSEDLCFSVVSGAAFSPSSTIL
jgi:hypothetical protein